MKITDEMVERAFNAYYAANAASGARGGGVRDALRRALEAALNPPPVVCKNCGKGEREHVLIRTRSGLNFLDSYGCPDYVFYVFEAAT